MRLDTVTAEIRPRSDWEAVDLGFALVRRDFWRCIAVWWLALAVPTLVGGVLLWDHPVLLLVLFWWLKPVGARMVLFELSRRLFGEHPSWRAVWRQIPRAWWRRFFYRFLIARFSPWLPVTLAVEDLEGLRGAAYRQRCKQLVRRGEGVLMWIYLLADVAAGWFGLGVLMLVLMLMPEGQGGSWQQALESWDPQAPAEIPLLISRTVIGCVMVAMSLTDVFMTGAGFGVYINNRTWIEGWDVELAFKRLAQRLGKVAVVMAIFLAPCISARGEEQARPPAEVMREVKADEAFKVHTVTDRIPVPREETGAAVPEIVKTVASALAIAIAAAGVGVILFMMWRHGRAFRLRLSRVSPDKEPILAARVVMGMEVAPDTLPSDVPAVAWGLWQQGLHQAALGLLYRGSISRVMEIGRVEIQESDTEDDCLRRVEAAGEAVFPSYFRGITGKWSQLAYAGVSPDDKEVQVLCEQWPFGKGRLP